MSPKLLGRLECRVQGGWTVTMSYARSFLAFAALAGLLAIPGCGGGRSGFASSIQVVGVPEGRNGLVLSGRSAVALTVEVKTSTGAPVSGAALTFLAPRTGPSGAFASPAPDGPHVYRAVTDAAGKATATFTRNDQSGVYLVDAVLDGAQSVVTFAVTNVAAPVTPPLSAEAARIAVERKHLRSRADDVDKQLHGPVLLPAGTVVENGPGLPGYPASSFTTTTLTWFFWLDEDPRAAFVHPVKYISLDATDAAAGFVDRAQVRAEGLWPRIRLPGGPAGGTSLTRASMRTDSLSRAVRFVPANASTRVPDDACAIFVFGPQTGTSGKNEVAAYRDFLISSGKVKAENCYPRSGDPAGDTPQTPSEVSGWVDQAKEKGCKKLYYISITHGHNGGIGLAKEKSHDSSYEDVSFQDMAAKLKGPWELSVFIWSCQSGTAAPHFGGPGFKGELVTSAGLGKASYFDSSYSFTYYSSAFLDGWKYADANGPNKGNATMEEAHKWVLEHAGDGKSDPAVYKKWTLAGGPNAQQIGSHYTVDPEFVKVEAGGSGTVRITRSGNIVQQETRVNLSTPSSGLRVTPTLQYSVGSVWMGVAVTSLSYEPQTYTVTAEDTANVLIARFFVTITQKVTLAKTLTASDGTTFAAGTVITTDRMTNYRVSRPDTGCDKWHLHSLSSEGITIDGKGPFADPQGMSCGYGLVIQPN